VAGTQLADHVNAEAPNPREPVAMLLRDLRSGPDGLSMREATRRLQVHGQNELPQRSSRRQFMVPSPFIMWGVDETNCRDGGGVTERSIDHD
jgi:hypothetical protein